MAKSKPKNEEQTPTAAKPKAEPKADSTPKSDAKPKPAPKKAAAPATPKAQNPAKPSAPPSNAPLIDTGLAAQAAAKMVVNRDRLNKPAGEKKESGSFKQLKESLKPTVQGPGGLLSPQGPQKKVNTGFGGRNQVGHNQTFGADVNRSGVPRREPAADDPPDRAPMRLNATGLIAATFTAFHPDGRLNLDLVERQAESLVRLGVVGAFVGGTTGEGQSLTSDERKRVLERWCAVAPKNFPIIAHVGHASVTEAADLARHAAKTNAVGIAAIPPYFYKSQNIDDILTCAAQVASAAPTLPFYYYHFPVMSGINISPSALLQQGRDRIPNLAGLKFTDDNLMELERCVALAGDSMDLFMGREGMMLAGLSMGGRASIGSSINFAAPVFTRVRNAFESRDIQSARKHQAHANAILAVFLKYGGLRAQKAAMNMAGPDTGPVRPPLRPLDDRELANMRKELESVAFFDLIRPG